jgi:hypothetical protein
VQQYMRDTRVHQILEGAVPHTRTRPGTGPAADQPALPRPRTGTNEVMRMIVARDLLK